jgi:microcystin-dependent protein
MINGVQSARLIHQAASSRSFKQTISVDRKYRSELMQLSLQVRSSASNGNLTLLVTDETNSATIAASQPISTASQIIASLVTNATTTVSGFSNSAINGLSVGMTVTGSGIPTGTVVNAVNTTALTITLSQAATASATVSLNFSALPDRRVFSFTIPASCASLSYTITALQEANLPESYIDDVVIELASTALLSTSVDVPVIETQTSRISQAASFGNADITGALTSSTGSGVYSYNSGTGVYTVIKNAQFDISATFRASGAASVQPLISDSSGSVEYATDTSLASAAARANASGSFYLTAGSTFKIRNALAGTTNEQYISVNAVYTSSTTKTIPLTQSGLIQEVDSYIRLYGANGYGSTATKIPRLATLDKSLGSDILYQDSATNGASFTIQRAGIYDIALSFESSSLSLIGLSLNSNQLTTNVNTISIASRLAYGVNNNGWGSTVSHSGYFNAGDVIRPHTDGAAISALTNFSISKQSSLKQVSVNPNSKMTLPSSELRMEGITGRGSTDTRVIQYSAISAIRGDAFTVASNSVNGTVITITKAGKISINANAQIAAGELFISKNQAVLTSNPLASETLGYSFSPSSADAQNVGFVGTVNVGDILRITSSSAPSASSGNLLTILHEETSIGVGVSNTLPQFSESDSCVRVVGANGYGSTNTSVRRFSSVDTNLGTDIVYTDSASLGGSFTVAVTGIYSISFSDTSNVSGTQSAISIQKNSTTFSQTADSTTLAMDNDRYNTNATIVRLLNASWTGTLVAGDVIRAVNDAANVNGASAASFTISKVGKPNVTGVDVTPFVNVQFDKGSIGEIKAFAGAVDVVSFLSCDGAAVSRTTYAELFQKLGTTHGQGDGSTTFNLPDYRGRFLRGVDGAASRDPDKLTRTAMNTGGNTGNNVGSVQADEINSHAHTYATAAANIASGAFYPNAPYGAGNTGLSTNNAGGNETRPKNAYVNYGIRFKAANEAIVTPTESFSTDTASLTYAGSATYTLSTLANAPVGTFITFTHGASSNTFTQTNAAPPSQATSNMNSNGIQLFARNWTAATTSASPGRVVVNIGKGLKGISVLAYASTGKSAAIQTDFVVDNAGGIQRGLNFKDYNEITGLLILDSATAFSPGVNSSFLNAETNSTQNNAYVVINASKSPALTGVPLLQPRFATIQDVKSAGTAAGAATSGAWTTHTLNTLVDSTGIVTSLSSNQFVLNPGTYNIFGDAQFFRVNECKLRIRNITDSTTSLVGESGYADVGASGGGITIPVFGEITISAAKTFELQWRVGTTKTINGLGSASNFGENEVYATVQIQKIK